MERTISQLGHLLQRQRTVLGLVLGSSKMDGLSQTYSLPPAMPRNPTTISSDTIHETSPMLRMPGLTLDERTNLGDVPHTSMWSFSLSTHTTPRDPSNPLNVLGPFAFQEQHTSPFDSANFEFAMPQYQLDDVTSSSRAPHQTNGASTEAWDSLGAAGNVDAGYRLYP